MSRTALILAGAMALSGSGLLVHALTGGPASDAGGTTRVVGAEDDSLELALRLKRLEDENLALQRRVADLEGSLRAQTAVRPEAQPLVAAPEAAELPPEVAALAASLRNPEAGVPDALLETVEAAVDRLRDEEEKERDARREERDLERINERVAELTEALGLDPYQAGEMTDLMVEGREARDTLRDDLRETRDFDLMREGMDKLREASEQRMAQFLTPSQIEQYEAMGGLADEGRRGGGGGRRGR